MILSLPPLDEFPAAFPLGGGVFFPVILVSVPSGRELSRPYASKFFHCSASFNM